MPPISPTPTPDRYSIRSRIARAYSDLEGAKGDHAIQSLQLAQRPDDEAVLELVRTLEKEIEGHRLNISRLEAAQAAGHQAETEESKAERAQQVVQLRGKVATLSDQLEPLLIRMIENIESVAPDLALYVSLAAQRREAAYAALRLAAGAKEVKAIFSNAMQTDGHGVLSDSLIGALARSGMGRVGPSLSPHVSFSVPTRPPTQSDAERYLKRDRDRLLDAIDRAVAPAPATTQA